MNTGQCKFCGEVRQFARAHIFPKSFYGIRDASAPHYIFSHKLTYGPKRSPKGIYDEELICVECESEFSYLDSYAAEKLKPWPRRSQLFRDGSGFILKLPDASIAGYWLTNINRDRLKLFFCFLAWRCAKTTREEFSISLPDNKISQLTNALGNKDASKANIHVFGFRYSDRKNTSLFSPWPRSLKDEKPINFVMYGLHFLMHFERPKELPELSLGHDSRWPIIFEEFRGSRLQQIAVRMATKFPSPWARLRSRNRVA